MAIADVHQARTNLSKLLDAAERGEDVVITRPGTGVTGFRLVAVAPSARRGHYSRLADEVLFSPDPDTADADIAEASAQHLAR